MDPNPDPTPAKIKKGTWKDPLKHHQQKNIRIHIQFTYHFRGAPNRGHLKFVFTKGSSGRSYYLLQLMAKKKTLRTLKIKAPPSCFFSGEAHLILRLVIRFPLIGSETRGFLAPRAKAKARSDLAAELQIFTVIFVVRIRY